MLWSTSGFFAQAPWFEAWPESVRGLMLAFWRSAFSLLVLAPMIRRPCWRWPMLPMVLCFTIMVWSYMSAMVHGPAANAIWLQYLSPAWVLLGGVLLLKEQVARADLRMLACCLTGVLLILGMQIRHGSGIYAAAMGILSGVTFAGVVLALRQMRDVDTAWLITLNHGATAVLLFPWVWQREEQIAPASYAILGLFGVFQMSLPYILFARALRSTPSPEASVLTLIEPVLVPIWVYVAWHHHASYIHPPWWTWVGGGLILTGLLSRYVPLLIRETRNRKRK